MPANKVYKLFSKYSINLEMALEGNKDLKITGGVMSTVSEKMFNELRKILPKKESFIEKFKEIDYKKKTRKLISYIFDKIETSEKYKEFHVSFPEVNIEHIYPQKPKEGWNTKNKKIFSLVDNIGNITLLHKKLNAKAGNKLPKDKIIDFEESKFDLNKDIIQTLKKSEDWNEKNIESRSEELAKKAYKIWSF